MPNNWLEEVYEARKQELFRFLFIILSDTQTAEDALQETFLKAYLYRDKYVEMHREKAWLYKIARNTAYDILRKRSKEFPIEKDVLVDTIDKEYRQESIQEDFLYMDMIADLKEIDREIVSLKIIAGLTHQEIGKILHMTTASVKKRYERALNQLRGKYRET